MRVIIMYELKKYIAENFYFLKREKHPLKSALPPKREKGYSKQFAPYFRQI